MADLFVFLIIGLTGSCLGNQLGQTAGQTVRGHFESSQDYTDSSNFI